MKHGNGQGQQPGNGKGTGSPVPAPQGRVYFTVLATPTASCPGPLYIGISEKTTGVEPVFIRGNKFSYSDSFDDGIETDSTVKVTKK